MKQQPKMSEADFAFAPAGAEQWKVLKNRLGPTGHVISEGQKVSLLRAAENRFGRAPRVRIGQ